MRCRLPQAVPLEQGKQGFRRRWFLDEIEGPERHDAGMGFRLDIAGDHDHLVAQSLPLEGLQHAIAVHFRHSQIEKDQIAVAHQDLLDPFQAVSGLMQGDIPAGRQGAHQLLASEPRVITYQYIHSVSRPVQRGLR